MDKRKYKSNNLIINEVGWHGQKQKRKVFQPFAADCRYRLWTCHVGPLLCWDIFTQCALLSIFVVNGCWILSSALCASIQMIIFLSFLLLMWCVALIDLWMLSHSRVSGINPTHSYQKIKCKKCQGLENDRKTASFQTARN